jgi:hypothetical protein
MSRPRVPAEAVLESDANRWTRVLDILLAAAGKDDDQTVDGEAPTRRPAQG